MGQVKNDGVEILRVLCGSRAYGLHDENSDYDYHGVFVVPTHKLLSPWYSYKETQWVEMQDADNTAWELGHFMKMAVQCNPTVLETFVAPVVSSPLLPLQNGVQWNWGQHVRDMFTHVLSKKRVYDAFRGYASNQRKKMFEPYGEDLHRRSFKAAVAYLRSLYHGQELLLNGTYSPKIASEKWRSILKDIKDGKHSKGFIIGRAEELEKLLSLAYEASHLPEEANLQVLEQFVLNVRKEMW